MSWARLDDGFHDHPKIDDLSLPAVGLWTLCLTWAHRHRKKALVPGHIPEARVRKLAGKAAPTLAAELVAARLWETETNLGGYLIHDFTDYLPKERDPQERSQAGRKGAAKRWQDDGKPDGKLPADSMASDGSCASAPAFPSRTEPQVVLPDPARPVPTTSGDAAPDVGALVAGFISQCRERPPSAYVARIGREIRALVLDHTTEDAIRGGLTIVAERGLQPGALAGCVHEHLNARPRKLAPSRNRQILEGAMERARAAEAAAEQTPERKALA